MTTRQMGYGFLGLSLATGLAIWLPAPHSHFDRNDWLARRYRVEMVEDIMEKHLHKGMTPSEVKSLLGKPNDDDPGTLRYYLGSRGWDSVALNVHFKEGHLDRCDTGPVE